MRILDYFDKYFLFLMLIEGYIVGFCDYKYFKNLNFKSKSMKARIVGIGAMFLGIVLFIAAIILQ